jgi:hypothetical protein
MLPGWLRLLQETSPSSSGAFTAFSGAFRSHIAAFHYY